MFLWQVDHVLVTSPGDQTTTEGGNVSLSIQAQDGGGAALSFSASGLPPDLGINTTTGVISGTVSDGDAAGGPYTVTVAATDGTTANSQTFTWNVNPHVTVSALSDQSSVEGNSVSPQAAANDGDGDTVIYSASGLPSGLTINSSTGLISGTVSAGDSANSPYAVTVSASDGTYSDSTSLNWAVAHPDNQSPTLTAPAMQSNSAARSLSARAPNTWSAATPSLSAGSTQRP
jgi:hypothetical protein